LHGACAISLERVKNEDQWRNYAGGDGGIVASRRSSKGGAAYVLMTIFILFNYKILSRFVALIYFVVNEKIAF